MLLNIMVQFWNISLKVNLKTGSHGGFARIYSFNQTMDLSFICLVIEATSLQGFLRAEETAHIRGNKESAVITSHLFSAERII